MWYNRSAVAPSYKRSKRESVPKTCITTATVSARIECSQLSRRDITDHHFSRSVDWEDGAYTAVTSTAVEMPPREWRVEDEKGKQRLSACQLVQSLLLTSIRLFPGGSFLLSGDYEVICRIELPGTGFGTTRRSKVPKYVMNSAIGKEYRVRSLGQYVEFSEADGKIFTKKRE